MLCWVKKKKDPKTTFKSQIEHDLNYEKRMITKNEEGNKPKMTSIAQVVGLLDFPPFVFCIFQNF